MMSEGLYETGDRFLVIDERNGGNFSLFSIVELVRLGGMDDVPVFKLISGSCPFSVVHDGAPSAYAVMDAMQYIPKELYDDAM